jgi:O-antigen ligase
MAKRMIVGAIFLSSAFLDAPSLISGGSVSLMGMLTILYAVAIAVVVFTRLAAARRVLLRLWPLTLLFLYSVVQLFWSPRTGQAAQTVCMQWIFLGLIVLMATGGNEGTDEFALSRMLRNCVIGGSLCFVIAFLTVGFGAEGIGALTFVTSRSFALFALLGIALFLSRWANGSRRDFWLAGALIVLIALSLSRAALVTGVLLVPLSRFRSLAPREMKRIVLVGAIALLGLYSLVFSIGPLRQRFLGANSLDDYVSGEASIDTQGRLAAWAITIASYVEAPWFGKGPGSANDLIQDTLYRLKLGHPHNEYLRFLHDEGLLGLLLLLAGMGQLAARCWRAYQRALESSSSVASVAYFHLTSFLSLVAVLITMLTDNTASYVFVMGPLAILVGGSIRALAESQAVLGSRSAFPMLSPAVPAMYSAENDL